MSAKKTSSGVYSATVDGVTLTEEQLDLAIKQIAAFKEQEEKKKRLRLRSGVVFRFRHTRHNGDNEYVYLAIRQTHFNTSTGYPVFEVAEFKGGNLVGMTSWSDGWNDYEILPSLTVKGAVV